MLGHHISHVVFVRSEPQMLRANTTASIAMMADVEADWNWTEMENPTCDVRPNHWHLVDSDIPRSADCTVATIATSSPYPALTKIWSVFRNWTALVHLGPKALWKSWRQSLRCEIFGGNVDAFNIHTMLSHALGYSFTARAFSL